MSVYWLNAVRWLARATGLALVLFVAVLAIGHGGPPNPLRQPTPVQLEFAAMAAMLTGFLIGWRWEAAGGALSLAGFVLFNAVEWWENGVLAFGAFPLFAVPSVLFLIVAWWGRHGGRPRGKPASSNFGGHAS